MYSTLPPVCIIKKEQVSQGDFKRYLRSQEECLTYLTFFFFLTFIDLFFLLTKIFLPFISGTLWKYHLVGDCLLLALDLPPLLALRCGHWHSASRVSALSSDSLAGFPRSGCSGDPGGGTRASSSPHLHPSPHFTPPAEARFSSCIWIQFTISEHSSASACALPPRTSRSRALPPGSHIWMIFTSSPRSFGLRNGNCLKWLQPSWML